jgi:uncharacterized membrane protein HdeD (DUF308 family)
MWTPKDIIILTLVLGFLLILGGTVIYDFYLAAINKKVPDTAVIQLLEKSLVGIVGIITGYFVARSKE